MANRLALLSRMVPLQLLTALLPAITAKFSHGASPAEMRDSYVHASRTLMIPTLLIVGFVAVALVSAMYGVLNGVKDDV